MVEKARYSRPLRDILRVDVMSPVIEEELAAALGDLAEPVIGFIKSTSPEIETNYDKMAKAIDDAAKKGLIPEGVSPMNLIGAAMGMQIGTRLGRHTRMESAL